ncbi:MAG: hypothetical protein D3903_10775 [Candidatus Electrothrix sp. GM3_4]|nr:hypothetical protein [Candidatus Electrothrix sp. GM3_4]
MKQKYSGKQISKTGEALLDFETVLNDKEKFEQMMNVLSYWRSTHQIPLNHAFKKLQEISLQNDKKAFFARRLKRSYHPSLFI